MKMEEVKTICNLGTGTMGSGIALTFALAGYQVNMYGRSEDSIKRGFERINNFLKGLLENGLVLEENIPDILSRIKGVTSLEEAAEGADFVIEAIAENLSAKREIFAKMEALCSPETIFATNTSGLSPTAIAEELEHKERFVVAHFWNPGHLLPLVEVVPGKYTSQETTQNTAKLLEMIGKKPVVLNREVLGFIGNRLQLAMLREAFFLLDSGVATKEAIDATVKYSLGRRLATTGPLESVDLGGLDVFYNISSYLFKDLCNSTEPFGIFKETVEKGNYGAKTGAGFYEWPEEALAKINKVRENNLMEWLIKDRKGN